MALTLLKRGAGLTPELDSAWIAPALPAPPRIPVERSLAQRPSPSGAPSVLPPSVRDLPAPDLPPTVSKTALTALMAVATCCDAAVVKALLAKGAAVDARDQAGRTPLALADAFGPEALAPVLLARGATVEVRDAIGRTPLLVAVEAGQRSMVSLLLARGADANAKDAAGRHPLMRAIDCHRGETVALLLGRGAAADGKVLTAAVRTGNRTLIRALLATGADAAAVPKDPWNTLVLAAVQGHEALVEVLGRPGVEVDRQGDAHGLSQGGTLLIRAATQDDRELVTWLLDLGAAVNAKDRRGATALVAALGHPPPEVARLLIARGADINGGGGALAAAVRDDDRETVRWLLDHGADVNARFEVPPDPDHSRGRPEGGTALTVAAQQGDPTGVPAVLSMAVARGDRELVQVLLDAGARVNARDTAGRNALSFAIAFDQTGVIPLLLAKGAEVLPADVGAALSAAVWDGQHAWLKALLERGATMGAGGAGGAAGPAGAVALLEAAERGDVESVRLVLDHGAAVEARSKFDESALGLAAAFRRPEVVRLLLARGAAVDARDRDGRTALMIAVA